MFPVLWYNLAASALAQACKMLCTKNSLIHWPLVLTKLRSQPTAPFFSGCFPSALIHIAFIVALHNSRCVHTHVFLLLMDQASWSLVILVLFLHGLLFWGQLFNHPPAWLVPHIAQSLILLIVSASLFLLQPQGCPGPACPFRADYKLSFSPLSHLHPHHLGDMLLVFTPGSLSTPALIGPASSHALSPEVHTAKVCTPNLQALTCRVEKALQSQIVEVFLRSTVGPLQLWLFCAFFYEG